MLAASFTPQKSLDFDLETFMPWNRITIPFEMYYILNLKTIIVTVVAENSWEFLRGIISCNWILLENKEL